MPDLSASTTTTFSSSPSSGGQRDNSCQRVNQRITRPQSWFLFSLTLLHQHISDPQQPPEYLYSIIDLPYYYLVLLNRRKRGSDFKQGGESDAARPLVPPQPLHMGVGGGMPGSRGMPFPPGRGPMPGYTAQLANILTYNYYLLFS